MLLRHWVPERTWRGISCLDPMVSRACAHSSAVQRQLSGAKMAPAAATAIHSTTKSGVFWTRQAARRETARS